MHYRAYLISEGRIQAAGSFAAESDSDALSIATALHMNSSDTFDVCELWQGPRQVHALVQGRDGAATAKLAELTQRRQMALLDLEDTLQQSFRAVAKSRALLDATADLRSMLARDPAPDDRGDG